MRVNGSRFVSGDLSSGQLVLRRDDGSAEVLPVLIFKNATLSDNGDSTFDLVFPGS